MIVSQLLKDLMEITYKCLIKTVTGKKIIKVLKFKSRKNIQKDTSAIEKSW